MAYSHSGVSEQMVVVLGAKVSLYNCYLLIVCLNQLNLPVNIQNIVLRFPSSCCC